MDAFSGIAYGHEIGQTRKAQNRAATTAWKWKRHAEELEEELEAAKRRIAQLEAHAAGVTTQVLAFAEAHPTSPLLENTSATWKDGTRQGQPKKKLTFVYEKAHDKRAIELGIKDPIRIRND